MKICEEPKLINDKAIDVLVDVAKRNTPKGYRINGRLNEESIRSKCSAILKCGGNCPLHPLWGCPHYCQELDGSRCGLYVKSK